MDTPATRFTRHVHYVAGFDPRGWRHIRNALKEAVDTWAARTQTPVTWLAADPTIAHPNLGIRTDAVDTRFVFLNWDETVRAHWPASDHQVAFQAAGFVLRSLFNGTLPALQRHTWPLAVSLSSTALPFASRVSIPVEMILGAGVGALLAGVPGMTAGAALGGAVGLWAQRKLHALATRLQSTWTARVALFTEQLAQDRIAGMDGHIDRFRATVERSLEQADETVLVGHSTGGILAPMVAQALVANGAALDKGRFTLLTVGSIAPYVAAHPFPSKAQKALDAIGTRTFHWIDISSPRDGAGGVLVNPADLLGTQGASPLLLNAQFHKTFAPERVDAAAKAPLDLHFLYFRATDIATTGGDLWDWPATLMDTRPVHARYAARTSQPSPYTKRRRA
jgi:hypothetical protein